jgi:outer membrane protein OmpA-like peptidoglycan-associated protein
MKDGRDIQHPLQLNVPMQRLLNGEKVVLHNIFFDTDKYELKSESTAELDRLTEFLKKNPTMKIEIGGHTDNVGTDQHNVELSQNRADAVYKYLIGKGIAKGRLSSKGYGKTMPVDTNDNAEGRANNRRTEFKVLEK